LTKRSSEGRLWVPPLGGASPLAPRETDVRGSDCPKQSDYLTLHGVTFPEESLKRGPAAAPRSMSHR